MQGRDSVNDSVNEPRNSVNVGRVAFCGAPKTGGYYVQ